MNSFENTVKLVCVQILGLIQLGKEEAKNIFPIVTAGKITFNRTCHWVSPKFHENTGKTALI